MSHKFFLLCLYVFLTLVAMTLLAPPPRVIVVTDVAGGTAHRSVSSERSPVKTSSSESTSPNAAVAELSRSQRFIPAGPTVRWTPQTGSTNAEQSNSTPNQAREPAVNSNHNLLPVWTDSGTDEGCRWAVDYPPDMALEAPDPSANLILRGLAVFGRDIYVRNALQWLVFEWDMPGWNNRLRPVPSVIDQPLPMDLATSIDLHPIVPTLPAFDDRPSKGGGSPQPRGPVAIPRAPIIRTPRSVADQAGSTPHGGDTANGGIPAAVGDSGESQDSAAGLTPADSIVSVPQPPSFMLLIFGGVALLWQRRYSVYRSS